MPFDRKFIADSVEGEWHSARIDGVHVGTVRHKLTKKEIARANGETADDAIDNALRVAASKSGLGTAPTSDAQKQEQRLAAIERWIGSKEDAPPDQIAERTEQVESRLVELGGHVESLIKAMADLTEMVSKIATSPSAPLAPPPPAPELSVAPVAEDNPVNPTPASTARRKTVTNI